MSAEAGDYFVEDKRGAVLLRDAPDFFQKLCRAEIGVTALHRFDENCSEFMGALTDDLQALRRAVVEHKDVRNTFPGNARRNWHRPMIANSFYQHLVKTSVIVTGEEYDQVATCHCTRQTHGSHNGFRARVTEGDAFHAGKIANQFRAFAGKLCLRSNSKTEIQLLMHRLNQEIGRVAKENGSIA